MKDPISSPWPFNFSVILAAIALLTANVSMMFENWAGTALMLASIAVDALAMVYFYRAWAVQSRH